jgi:hypothetical protein
MLRTLAATLALVVAGCSAQQPSLPDLPDQVLAGHFTSGGGESWFRPCDAEPGDPSWWVTVTGRAVEQVEAARAEGRLTPGERHFVRWRAAITTGGEVGPQGPGTPALLVREVLELRPASEDDCSG